MADPHLFGSIIRKFGEPQNAVHVSYAEAEHYRGKVPDGLIRFWIEHGRGTYNNTILQMCDPDEFRPIMVKIFAGDPEFDPEDMYCYVYNDSAIQVWQPQQERNILIHYWTSNVTAFPMKKRNPPGVHDLDNEVAFGIYTGAMGPIYPIPEHEEALRLYGPLALGEMFAYVPALQLGGAHGAQNMRKVRAAEHFMFLAQVTPWKLDRHEIAPGEPPPGRSVFVRMIGPQR